MKSQIPPRLSPVNAGLPANRILHTVRRVLALALAVLLLPLSQVDLLAQQAGPYGGQYPPQQQTAYGQQPYYPQAYPPQQQYPQPQQYPRPQNPGYGQPESYTQQQAPYGQQGYPQQQQAYSAYGQNQMQAQPLGTQQLEQLVAPIALYPDPLVAQVLTASTYPAQIADADRWRQAQGYGPAEQIAAGADAQNWDPSVKALTAFPQVLAQLDRNMRWTTDLGNAYYNQPEDILQAVQQLRQRAQAAGNLQSNPQETVSYDQGAIEVAPANPQVVYVPAYNPWAVYGPAISPYPGFYLLGALGSFLGAAVQFGLGIGIAPFSRLPFGFLGWGLSWLAHAVLFHNSYYFSHSTSVADWGFAHGGHRAFAAGGFNREPGRYNSGYGNGFNRSPQGFGNRPVNGFARGYESPRVSYNRPVQQAYNHMQPAFNGAQQFARSGYGSSGYRAPAAGFGRSDFGQRSSGGFGGQHFNGFSGKAPSSGGFHGFGGGHAPKNFGGGHSGGGHFGGGHSGGGHFGGKHRG